MAWYEILVIVCAAAFVAGIAAWQLIRRKRGMGGCGGDCSCCCRCGKKEENAEPPHNTDGKRGEKN